METEELELPIPDNINYENFNKIIEGHNKYVLDIKNKAKRGQKFN